MRVIFAGTPEVAVHSLRAILASQHEVVAVLTRPDAPVGRGRKLSRSAVANAALDAGVPLLQLPSLRDPDAVSAIAAFEPDACPVVAYGALIPRDVLAVPRFGWINLHFSLLPAWRGAAPVQHAIWAGDDVTGATTFLLEEGLDTGPVLGTMVEPLGSKDTSGAVLARLAESGAGLLRATLDGVASGLLTPIPQPADGVTLAPKITVSDARIDWTLPAIQIDRQSRACTPVPGAWSTFRGSRLKVFPVAQSSGVPLPAGAVVQVQRNVWAVGTGTTPVLLGDVQPAGKKRMPAADWLRGLPPVSDDERLL